MKPTQARSVRGEAAIIPRALRVDGTGKNIERPEAIDRVCGMIARYENAPTKQRNVEHNRDLAALRFALLMLTR